MPRTKRTTAERDTRKRISLDEPTYALFQQLIDREGRQCLAPLLQYAVDHPGFPSIMPEPSMTTPTVEPTTPTLIASNGSLPLSDVEAFFHALHITGKQAQSIRRALADSDMPLETFVHIAMVQASDRHATMTESLATRDVENPTERMRIRGAGLASAATAVQQLIEANLRAKATHPDDMVYLTRGQVAALTGTNRSDINLYFDANAAMIDAHNRTLGFANAEEGRRHNLKRGKLLAQKLRESTENPTETDS